MFISILISNIYYIYTEYTYSNFKYYDKELNIKALIVSNFMEKEYNVSYKIKVKNINNKKCKDFYLILQLSKNNKILKYGDYISFNGKIENPSKDRNYGGFNYKNYLKTKKIKGTVKLNFISILEKNKGCLFLRLSNNLQNSIKEKIKNILPKESAELLIGILLGDISNLPDDINNNFRNSNLSHMLAISGSHISFITLGFIFIFNKINIRKDFSYFLSVIVIIFFIFLTNLSPSVVRASIMGGLYLLSKIFFRKSNINNNLAISLLIILIYNPFSILDVGLQLSFLGTIGIVFFYKNLNSIFDKLFLKSSNIFCKIKEAVLLTVSAQIMIMFFMIINFNTFSTVFILSNLLASPFLISSMILGFITVIISYISFDIAKIIAIFLNISLNLFNYIAEFSSKIPFANIFVVTPKFYNVIIYYFTILLINYFVTIKNIGKNYRNILEKKIIKFVNGLKNKSKIIIFYFFIVVIIINYIDNFNKNLQVFFVDVGQGDATLVITPSNKKILIDGGGSDNFDVGKNTMLPYLLDRRVNSLDYIFISHFDSDHCKSILYIIQKIKVKNIIIGMQYEKTDNYSEFIKIVKNKKINVTLVKCGDKIYIEKDLYFNILWPDIRENMILNNSTNNNSLVCKMIYKKFSMLFTGDIEQIAEKAIIKKYQNNVNVLKSTVLKVAHHGSKTSSNNYFLSLVEPKYALIGVGKNNMFRHPSNITLKNLQNINTNIFRTDTMGEIIIKTNGKKIKIKKKYN